MFRNPSSIVDKILSSRFNDDPILVNVTKHAEHRMLFRNDRHSGNDNFKMRENATMDGEVGDRVSDATTEANGADRDHTNMKNTEEEAERLAEEESRFPMNVSNHLELFVRAGKDGESLGGCPLCQRIFIILLSKAKAGQLTFTVTTVNMSKPPAEFKRLASRLPVLIHGPEIICDPDEMIQYIDERFPHPQLEYHNERAAEVCMDVFSKFSFYIKDVSHSTVPLLMELQRLNDYLESSPHKFLCRSTLPDHLDCLMLPKLQHIRVVAKAFKDFEIPSSFSGLWRYLDNAYSSDIFRQTCPSDQEIVYHWQCKPECPRLSKEKQNLYSPEGRPRYSIDLPKDVVIKR